jgi:uncharacterized SAM-dependent methyltransferase
MLPWRPTGCFEAFDPKATSRGGLCILRGDPVILVDSGATTMDKVGVLCDALARFDVEILYVPPAIRARMQTSTWRPDGARGASR